MRTAGIIGGLGPESTIDYYRSIISRYRARKAGGRVAEQSIFSGNQNGDSEKQAAG
jgi:aspartate racemase